MRIRYCVSISARNANGRPLVVQGTLEGSSWDIDHRSKEIRDAIREKHPGYRIVGYCEDK